MLARYEETKKSVLQLEAKNRADQTSFHQNCQKFLEDYQ